MSKYIKLEDAISVCQLKQIIRNGDSIGVRYPTPEEIMNDLSDLPTIEVEEDCISREYLKSFEYINKGDFNSVETIREWIDNAPSVVPTTEKSSKVGEWQNYKDEHRCSECGEVVIGDWYDDEWYDYGPNCGADMRGEQDE